MYLWTITFTKHITEDLFHVFYFIMNLYFAPYVTVSLNWFVECIWIKSSSCVVSLFVYACHNEKDPRVVAQRKKHTSPQICVYGADHPYFSWLLHHKKKDFCKHYHQQYTYITFEYWCWIEVRVRLRKKRLQKYLAKNKALCKTVKWGKWKISY